ncbi:hypothetical protein HRI_004530900 [Hibiscus trionum]|uniref:Reverse transcriptase domain-containing protein n=1 Tax=Hibiscus trionum TaxID=183268 RepID=A0A9W7J5T0_HIBTR|nr:hypothetical protein HRI_004530900 [Hibiscus trionum]
MRKSNLITRLRDGSGRWLELQEELRNHAVEFYSHLFTSGKVDASQFSIHGRFLPLSDSAVDYFDSHVSMDEARKAVFHMAALKAPGVDGLHALFYQRNWNIVGADICRLVQDIFEGAPFPENLNDTLPVMIPKVKSPENMSQFRPISLCQVLYKIVTKVVVNRIKPFISEWVKDNQTSFVPGRLISDNIIIAQEVVHSMRRKTRAKGWMAEKIDLERAYDRL